MLLAMLEQGSVGRVNGSNVVWHGRAYGVARVCLVARPDRAKFLSGTGGNGKFCGCVWECVWGGS